MNMMHVVNVEAVICREATHMVLAERKPNFEMAKTLGPPTLKGNEFVGHVDVIRERAA
jgi:hypothetical protein